MNTYIQQLRNLLPNVIWLSLFFCLFSSCDRFVEVDLPANQLVGNTVFENKTTANAALANVYAQIRDNGLLTGKTNGLSMLLGNYADELTFYGADGNSAKDFFNNSLIASNVTVAGLWNGGYKQIYSANAVIEGLVGASNLTEQDKSQFMGEALFVRALLHFYLANLFDDIPYITITDYQINKTAFKLPVAQVYERVIADLEKSITLLPDNYITSGRVRPNVWVAKALLARVFLYHNKWKAAEETATAVIEHTALYTWESNIDKVFLKESTATIWQFMPSAAGKNTDEGSAFIFSTAPPPLVALSSDLMGAFSGDDLRKSHWAKAISNGVSTWYHANKYKQKTATASSLENSIVFRLAEQYLIRAEARVHLDHLPEAREDLDKIRGLAGLENTTASTAESILEAILKERRLEFFTESGHRFFDLKRMGALDKALSGLKPGWNTTDRLFPIPETEIKLNTNLLPQNQGY